MKQCLVCKKEFKSDRDSRKFCCHKCYWENKKGKPAWNKGLKGFRLGEKRPNIMKKGKFSPLFGRARSDMIGENHYNYIKDRTKLKKQNERNDYSYQEWRKDVWIRDNWKCKISNSDCKGRIEAHHILSWKDYPELRYSVNNGITLCHAHHPFKRAEEKRLIPTFVELVSVSKIQN